ncbi:TetR/AcrR family transcriptional regulator [Castellaniella sp.]|uniref:TetR/AcrR family transcriptional regulator n=1 Tax=Castellaniella sp. TaxID=1955812 RepID=UPI003C722BFA
MKHNTDTKNPPARHREAAALATRSPKERDTYRHGDLKHALLEAGVALAREGGPQAIVLREATRRVGVVPNAAYRHFTNREALLQAVRAAALSELARAMEDELARLPSGLPAPAFARSSVRAIGAGYLSFARKEPGLFRTAFAVSDRVEDDTDPAKTGRSGLNPFQLLGKALDELVKAGSLPAERRPGAEYLAWSSVHGLAMLMLDGPLRGLAPDQVHTVGEHLLNMVERGL